MQNQHYKINIGFIIDTVDNEVVIFDGERSVLHTINDTGYFIFKLLKNSKSNDQIVNELVKQYKLDRATAEKDVSDFIKLLLKKKIISLAKD